MAKGVGITIVQCPVEVVFTCVHCNEEIEIDYDKFKNITNSELVDIMCDYPRFNCPKCEGKLYVDEVDMD